MTLSASVDFTVTPPRLTVTSSSRVHPAQPEVTENYRITVEQLNAAGTVVDTKVVTGSRVVTPAVPASTDTLTVVDDSGRVWTQQSDNGSTAVYLG